MSKKKGSPKYTLYETIKRRKIPGPLNLYIRNPKTEMTTLYWLTTEKHGMPKNNS